MGDGSGGWVASEPSLKEFAARTLQDGCLPTLRFRYHTAKPTTTNRPATPAPAPMPMVASVDRAFFLGWEGEGEGVGDAVGVGAGDWDTAPAQGLHLS